MLPQGPHARDIDAGGDGEGGAIRRVELRLFSKDVDVGALHGLDGISIDPYRRRLGIERNGRDDEILEVLLKCVLVEVDARLETVHQAKIGATSGEGAVGEDIHRLKTDASIGTFLRGW